MWQIVSQHDVFVSLIVILWPVPWPVSELPGMCTSCKISQSPDQSLARLEGSSNSWFDSYSMSLALRLTYNAIAILLQRKMTPC
jgi:hypothetical protein